MCYTPVTLVRDREDWTEVGNSFGGAAYQVPCGKCPACLKRRRNDWSLRLYEELKVSDTACFVTLTYEDPPLSFNGIPTLVKRDLQLWMKRLRKRNKTKIKYYAVGEYGTLSDRPHYHAIMFNVEQGNFQSYPSITKAWDKGHVHVGAVSRASISYTTGYVMSGNWTPRCELDDRQPHFSLMSKGLGKSYIENPEIIRYHRENLDQLYVTNRGNIKVAMPRYYRDKIFT